MSLFSVLVSQGRCIKVPQVWWLKTAEIYSLTVLEARSSGSSCGQVGFFWKL